VKVEAAPVVRHGLTLRAFLNLALDGNEWPKSHSGLYTPGDPQDCVPVVKIFLAESKFDWISIIIIIIIILNCLF
jgi:hypothetical protein